MICQSRKSLAGWTKIKGEVWKELLLEAAVIISPEKICFDENDSAYRKAYGLPLGGTIGELIPIPRKLWPDWIKNFSDSNASDDDLGFGDTIARVIGDPLSIAVEWLTTLAGATCGCKKRKEDWNALYPYR